MEKRYYGAVDGLRTMACIGIVLMHIKANNNYNISGFVYENVISSFTDFVFLFVVISAFGLCCGYYEQIIGGKIDLEIFYKQRYAKIFPCFAILILLDIAISPSMSALYEAFADMTLLFGFFPNKIEVIGVGWFVGLIFVFYIIFPFYCILIRNKKRAWIFFVIALIMNHVVACYFKIDRTNIIYCFCYLLAGGLVYLHREELEKISKQSVLGIMVVMVLSVILYFIIGSNVITTLLVSVTMLICALICSGGYCRTGLQSFLVLSVWKYIYHIWLYLGWLRKLV